MRMRTTYTTFEQTVIDLYDQKALTLNLLDTLGLMYRGIEVDSAGSQNLLTGDGKDVQQVCITLVNPSFTLAERGGYGDDEEYWECELKEWSRIVSSRWGWS